MLPFKTSAVVQCDDIRVEQNGKFILIGVYTGTVVVTGFPAELATSWWIQLFPEKIGKFEIEIQVIKDDGASVLRGLFTYEVREISWAVLPIPRTPINLQSTGRFKLELRLKGDDKWTTIQEFQVVVGNVVGAPMQTMVSN